MKKTLNLATVISLGILTIACSGDSTADLRSYVKEIKNSKAMPIKPLPEIPTYVPAVYTALQTDSPFATLDKSIVDSALGPVVEQVISTKPDYLRTREYLESFNLSDLKMLGSFNRGAFSWAILEDNNKRLHSVKVGDFIGKNSGRIINVTKEKIILQELVQSSKEGWKQRKTEINLFVKGESNE